jgi:hypothetical protein
MASERFEPQTEVSFDQIKGFFKDADQQNIP